jgi:hypothetical protein
LDKPIESLQKDESSEKDNKGKEIEKTEWFFRIFFKNYGYYWKNL